MAEHAPAGTDIDRVVRMLLVHDIVEIDAGDTFIYDRVAVEAQEAAERPPPTGSSGYSPATRPGPCGSCGTSSRRG